MPTVFPMACCHLRVSSFPKGKLSVCCTVLRAAQAATNGRSFLDCTPRFHPIPTAGRMTIVDVATLQEYIVHEGNS